VLATDFAGVLALAPNGTQLRLAAAEWSSTPDPDVGAAGAGTQPRYTLEASEPVVMADASSEPRFEAWPPELASAATVLMKDHEQRFGVVEAASRFPRHFDRDEITFLQSIANLLAAAVARFRAESQVRHQALHDALTGLPNRALFVDRLTHALARSTRRGHTGLVVLFADLDGFKHINDSLGHHAGDELLVSLASRLTAVMRSGDSLARFGGDEFMMLFEDLDGEEKLLLAVKRVQAAVTATPFMIEGQAHTLHLSIGVVRAHESHASPGDIVRDADAAMYHAKHRGRGGYAVFDPEMRDHAVQRLRIEQELRAAIDAGELRLLYQPIVSLQTGRIVELEALLRWQHPERGLLEPADFLDAAIESGLIVPIGNWALPEACRQAAAWSTVGNGAPAPTVNVNMAPSELAQPELRETVRAALQQTSGAVSLQLELTEGALIEDPSLPATLRDLSGNLGVRVALDDFGTGYSSLSYLTRFKIDELKVDQSFIRTLTRDRDAPIVAAIVNMAHALDILVVAEGIETEEQATQARRYGCDRGQGRFYSYPLPPEAIPTLLAEPRLPGR
jgi:diguanylate cyclase (GGDEF)-like protein